MFNEVLVDHWLIRFIKVTRKEICNKYFILMARNCQAQRDKLSGPAASSRDAGLPELLDL